jgi:hypothetical protein
MGVYMVKITGLDKLQKTLSDAQKAAKEIDGEIGAVSFNPSDPASIEAAIQNMEAMIDERLGSYSDNPIIGPMAEKMKETYREAIIEKAAAERLKGDAVDE